MIKEKEKYHFVFITTNIITKKQYIGDHSTIDLNDNYLGSGFLIRKSISKYGTKNFKREILESFSTKEKAFNAQEKYIIKFNTLNPNGYNISPKGGLCVKGCLIHSEETKIKQRIAKLGKKYSDIHKKHMSISHTGLKLSEEHKLNIGKGNKGKNIGKHRSDKAKLNYRKAKLGISRSEKARESIRNGKLGKKRNKKLCPHCNKDISDNMYGRWHGNKCKQNLNKF